MRRFVLVALCAAMLIACSGNSNNCSQTPPVHEVAVPSAGPAVSASAEEPKPPEKPKPTINWHPFNEETRVMLNETGLCAMLYFNSDKLDGCTHCEKLSKTLEDEDVITLINDAFVPVKFPVEECAASKECIELVQKELGVTIIPTTVLVFSGEESVSLIAEGGLSIEEFKQFLFHKKKLYDNCKSLKAEHND